jgi:hypothetical protein
LYNHGGSPARPGVVPPNKTVAAVNSLWLLSTATPLTAQLKLYERAARVAVLAILACGAQMRADFAAKSHEVFAAGRTTVQDLQRWLGMVIAEFKSAGVPIDWGKVRRGAAAAFVAPFIRDALQEKVSTSHDAEKMVVRQFAKAAFCFPAECAVEAFVAAPLVDGNADMASVIETVPATAATDSWPELMAGVFKLPTAPPASVSTKPVTGAAHPLVVAFVGPKGGGKTTLFKRLACCGSAEVESPWEALVNGSSATVSATVDGTLLAAYPGQPVGIPARLPSHTAGDDVLTRLVVAYTVPFDKVTAELLKAAWEQFTATNSAGLFAVIVTKIDTAAAGSFGDSVAWDAFASQLFDHSDYDAATKCYQCAESPFALSGPWHHGYVGLNHDDTRKKSVLARAYAPSAPGTATLQVQSWSRSALAAVKEDGGLPGSQAERILDIHRVANAAQPCHGKAYQNLITPATPEVGAAGRDILRQLVQIANTLPSNLKTVQTMLMHHGYRQQERWGQVAGLGNAAQAKFNTMMLQDAADKIKRGADPSQRAWGGATLKMLVGTSGEAMLYSQYSIYIDAAEHPRLYELVNGKVPLFQYPMATPAVKFDGPGHIPEEGGYEAVWGAHQALLTTTEFCAWDITDRTEFKPGGVVVTPGPKPSWLLSADPSAGTYTGFAHITVQSLFPHPIGTGMSLQFLYPARHVHAVITSVCYVYSRAGGKVAEVGGDRAGFVCRSEFGHKGARTPDTATSRHNGLQPGDVIVVRLDRKVFVPSNSTAVNVVLKAVPTTKGCRHVALGKLR